MAETENKNLTIAEQEALSKEEIQKLIRLAKEKGHLTIVDINESLPQEITAPTVLDQVMFSLEANGVVINEYTEQAKADEKGLCCL